MSQHILYMYEVLEVLGEEAPLDPWLEYPMILLEGGFHLVRGVERASATIGYHDRG